MYTYALIRILQQVFVTGAYVATQSYAIEIVGMEYRQIVQCLVCGIPSSIGYIIMAVSAYGTSDWRDMILVHIGLVIPGNDLIDNKSYK